MSETVDPDASNNSSTTERATILTQILATRFVVQTAGIAAVMTLALLGYAWFATGSSKLVWPWLRGDRLAFDSQRIDFGTVPKNEIIERRLHVVNLSSSPLTLLGSQPSCDCISLDDFPIVIPAGKRQALTLKIGTPDKAGAFEHVVKFFSNDQKQSSVVVTVSGVGQ